MPEDISNEASESAQSNAGVDVDMEGATAVAGDETVVPADDAAEQDAAPEPKATFISHLMSPVVTLIVGHNGSESILTAHQSLLAQSPFFQEACAQFADDGSVSRVLDPPAAKTKRLSAN